MDLNVLNPNWTLAQNHSKANKAGIPRPVSSTANIVLCQCCHEQIDKDPVPLWENSKQLQFLGFGYPLFYEYLKNCIILLVLTICSYDALSVFWAVHNNYQICNATYDTGHRLLASSSSSSTTTPVCTSFLVQMSRIQTSVSTQQQAMRVISFVLHALALVYVRNRILKLEAYYDERTTSLSDYSVFIKGIQKGKGIQAKVREFFRKQLGEPHEIKQITLLPEYTEIEELEKQKMKVIDQLRPFIDNSAYDDSEDVINLNSQLKLINLQIQEATNKSMIQAEKDELQCERIICVFNTQEEKDTVLQQFQEVSMEIKKQYFGQSGKVYMKEAPEPEQIIWQNANMPTKKRLLYLILGWTLSFLVLIVIFIVFFFVLGAKTERLEHALKLEEEKYGVQKYIDQKNGAITLVYVMIFLVTVFNKAVLSTIYHKFTDMQHHSNTSKYQFSYALKYCLGLFFTTALMTLAVQAIRFKNYYSHPYGVIDEETIMFFMNSFFVPFFWIVNPTRIMKYIKMKLYYGKKSLTQQQANHLMEQQTYDMGKRFAEVTEMMWFTFFYSTLIPIGAVITCAGVLFYYWVDKYNLLRRSSVNGQISGKLINTSLTMLDFTLILRPIGSIIFDNQIRKYQQTSIVMIVVAFAFIILPKDRFIQILNNEKFRPESQTYESVKNKFDRTYHSLHPVYKKIHKDRIKKRITSKYSINTFGTSSGNLNDSTAHLNVTPQKIYKGLQIQF